MAKKYKVGIDAIALRFVIDSIQPTFVLSGASNMLQLTQNLRAMDFELTATDLDLLKSIGTISGLYWGERALLNWN